MAFLNNLAYAFDQRPWWEAGYYAGTFGEYGMAAVRREASDKDVYYSCRTASPAGQAGRGRRELAAAALAAELLHLPDKPAGVDANLQPPL